jgi:hypothetical protein
VRLFRQQVFGRGAFRRFSYATAQTGLAFALIILALIVQRACCVATKFASH